MDYKIGGEMEEEVVLLIVEAKTIEGEFKIDLNRFKEERKEIKSILDRQASTLKANQEKIEYLVKLLNKVINDYVN